VCPLATAYPEVEALTQRHDGALNELNEKGGPERGGEEAMKRGGEEAVNEKGGPERGGEEAQRHASKHAKRALLATTARFSDSEAANEYANARSPMNFLSLSLSLSLSHTHTNTLCLVIGKSKRGQKSPHSSLTKDSS
jgi:hypothetical protein